MMIKKLTLTLRQRKWLSVIAIVAVLYTLAGFFLVPAIARHLLPDLIRGATGRDSDIGTIAFHPYHLSLQVKDFELKEKNGQPFVRFAELYANFNIWRSLRLRLLSFAEVRMEKPFIHVERLQNGAFNFDDMFLPAPPGEEESRLLPFEIEAMTLKGGLFDWRDRFYKEPTGEIVQPVNLAITGLTTRQDAESAFDVSLTLASGATLAWNGKLTLAPLHSEGRIHIRELQSRRLSEWFLQDNEFIALTTGVNAIDTQYRLDYQGDTLHVDLDPLQIAVENFSLNEKGEKTPFVALQAFKLSDSELQLQWTQATNQWQIKAPQGRVHIKKFALSNPQGQKLHFEADDFALQGLGFDLQFQDTLQFNVSHQKIAVTNSSFSFEGERPLKISAGLVDVGPTEFSARQTAPQSALELKATQKSLTMQKLAVALPAQRKTLLNAEAIAAGKVQFELHPKEGAAPEIKASQDKFTAKQLSLREAGQTEPLASVASATVNGVQFDLDKKLIKIATAATTGSEIKAWLASDGTLNYQTLFAGGGSVKEKILSSPPLPKGKKALVSKSKASKPGPPPLSVKAPSAPPVKWTAVIGKLAVDNGALHFEDRSRQPQTAFKLSAINFAAENFSTTGSSKIPLRVSALFNGNSKVALQGDIVLQPFNAAFDIKIEEFPLQPFQPYVNRFARLDVLSGALYVDGKLALDLRNGAQPQITFRGATGITRFHSRDRLLHKDFAKWEQFALRNVAFDLQPLRFDVAEILIDQPYLRVAIDKDKTVNFADIAVMDQNQHNSAGRQERSATHQDNASVRQSAGETEKGAAMAFNIGKIKVRQGRSDFSDFALIIPFAAFIDHLDGRIEGLSSQRDAETSLLLQGLVLDVAPVVIEGRFQPYRGVSKVSINFDNLPLPAATPYMAEFAGYKIEKGKMSLDLNYEIAKGRLQASNKMLIDQIVLGEKVDSPRAVSLPLDLAVALLKDTQGRIKLDFPITGSLEDPKFSIRTLIVDALTNVISKVVTSPFRAIAALTGRKDGDMGLIEFKPGSAALAASETAKLDGIATVFEERKVLKLDIKGIAYQQQDWPELTGDALREQLEDTRARELRRQGKAQAAENVELSADEYRRLLADRFIAKFPQLAKRSLFGAPKLINDDKSDFYAVAEQKLREQFSPDSSRLNALAAERGRAIAKYLVRQKGIDSSRIFILDSKVEPKASEHSIVTVLFLRGG